MLTGWPASDPGRRAVRLGDRALFIGCALAVLVLSLRAAAGGTLPDDLQVYKGSVDAWLSGEGLYSYARPNGDRFTYPPGAAVALAWVHLFNAGALAAAWVLLTGGAMAVSAIAMQRRVGAPAGIAFLLLLVSAAGRSNLQFGQVSVFIFALCLADCCLMPRRYRGVLTGLAAAIKLTPLLFLVYFLVRRQWGDLVRAATAGLVLTGIGLVLLPSATIQYLQSGLRGVSSVSHWDSLGNQSLRAVFARLEVTDHAIGLLVSAVLVLAVLVWTMKPSTGDDLIEWTIIGLVVILVSPISWTHHRFWLTVPLLIPFLWEGRREQLQRLTLTVGVLLFTIPSPSWAWPLRSLGFTTCVLLLCVILARGRRTVPAATSARRHDRWPNALRDTTSAAPLVADSLDHTL